MSVKKDASFFLNQISDLDVLSELKYKLEKDLKNKLSYSDRKDQRILINKVSERIKNIKKENSKNTYFDEFKKHLYLSFRMFLLSLLHILYGIFQFKKIKKGVDSFE